MDLPNIFTQPVSEIVIERINHLTPHTVPAWGKMSVSQMLAHCNVSYEMVYENKHAKPNLFMRFIIKSFVKKLVTSSTPYKHNSQTAPQFVIKDQRDFKTEKNRLIQYISDTQKLGETHFDNKESLMMGALTKNEWNNLFYKHVDHHLQQFGV